jgi:hypothetical protein
MNYYDDRRYPKKKTFKQRFILWLKRVLRSIYFMGRSMQIFIASAVMFVFICIVLIFAISGSRHKKAEAMSMELTTLRRPTPTIFATATPEPTPFADAPRSEVERGREGEDVMSLQEAPDGTGILAIDEPTIISAMPTKYGQTFSAAARTPARREMRQRYHCAYLFGRSQLYVMYVVPRGTNRGRFSSSKRAWKLGDSQITGITARYDEPLKKIFKNRATILPKMEKRAKNSGGDQLARRTAFPIRRSRKSSPKKEAGSPCRASLRKDASIK